MNKRFLALFLSISLVASMFSCIPVLAEESPNFTAGTIAKEETLIGLEGSASWLKSATNKGVNDASWVLSRVTEGSECITYGVAPESRYYTLNDDGVYREHTYFTNGLAKAMRCSAETVGGVYTEYNATTLEKTYYKMNGKDVATDDDGNMVVDRVVKEFSAAQNGGGKYIKSTYYDDRTVHDGYGYDTNGAYKYTLGANPQKERIEKARYYEDLVYSFLTGTEVTDIFFGGQYTSPYLRTSNYQVFISNSASSLFDEENMVYHFQNDFNGVQASPDNVNTFVQHIHFDEPQQAAMVGIRILDPVSALITTNANYYNCNRISLYSVYGSTPSLDDHIPVGLVADYSIDNNTGSGFSADSTVWKDISGNGNDVTVAKDENNYFTEDGYVSYGKKNNFPQAVVDVINSDEFTVEFIIDDYDNMGTESIVSVLNDSSDMFGAYIQTDNLQNLTDDKFYFKTSERLMTFGNGRPVVGSANDKIPAKLVSLVYSKENPTTIYVNGELAGTTSASTVNCKATDLFFGHDGDTTAYGGGSRKSSVIYKNIRFYDRAISTVDMLHNTNVDGIGEKYVSVAQPRTNIVGDIALIKEINSKAELDEMLAADSLPSNAIFTVNSSLEVVDANGVAFTDVKSVINALDYKILPVFKISDTQTADKLSVIYKRYNFYDLAVMGSEEVVKYARTKDVIIRGVIDYTSTYTSALTDAQISDVITESNRNKGTLVVLSKEAATPEAIKTLFQSMTNVWLLAGDSLTEAERYSSLLSGATGVISDDFDELLDIACNKLAKNTLTRASSNVAHRGLSGVAPENTVYAVQRAFEEGAQMVEIDLFLTTDNEIILTHDVNTSFTCDKALEVKESSLDQLKDLWVVRNNSGLEFPEEEWQRLATLDEMFEAFKDTDLCFLLEFKDTRPEAVIRTKEIIEEYGMQGRCVALSKAPSTLNTFVEQMPEMKLALLDENNNGLLPKTDTDSGIINVMEHLGPYNAYLNTKYDLYGRSAGRTMLIRGLSITCWTLKTEALYNQYALWGYPALMGDYADYMSYYPRNLHFSGVTNGATVKRTDTLTVDASLELYKSTKPCFDDLEFEFIEGSDIIGINGNTMYFKGAGKVTFIPKIKAVGGTSVYTLYAEPVTITVTSNDSVKTQVNGNNKISYKLIPKGGATSADFDQKGVFSEYNQLNYDVYPKIYRETQDSTGAVISTEVTPSTSETEVDYKTMTTNTNLNLGAVNHTVDRFYDTDSTGKIITKIYGHDSKGYYYVDSEGVDNKHYLSTWDRRYVLRYDLAAPVKIHDILIGTHENDNRRTGSYKIYASNDADNLISDENLVFTYLDETETLKNAKLHNIHIEDGVEAKHFAMVILNPISYNSEDYTSVGTNKLYLPSVRITAFRIYGEGAISSYQTSNDVSLLNSVTDESVVGNIDEIKYYEMKNGEFSLVADLSNNAKKGMLIDKAIAKEDWNESKIDFKAGTNGDTATYEYYTDGSMAYMDIVYKISTSDKIKSIVVANHGTTHRRNGYYILTASNSRENLFDNPDYCATIKNYDNQHQYQRVDLPSVSYKYVGMRVYDPESSLTHDANDFKNRYFRIHEFNVFGEKAVDSTEGSGVDNYNAAIGGVSNLLENKLPISKTAYNNGISRDFAVSGGSNGKGGLTSLTTLAYDGADVLWSGANYVNSDKTAIIDDETKVYQQMNFELDGEAVISKIGVYGHYRSDLTPSHFKLSFADSESELFKDSAVTYDIYNSSGYVIIDPKVAPTAKYFAIRVICAVQNSALSNELAASAHYGRIGHIALIGEYTETAGEVSASATDEFASSVSTSVKYSGVKDVNGNYAANGAKATVSADAEVTVNETKYGFIGWSDGSAIVSEEPEYTFSVSSEGKNLIAQYATYLPVSFIGRGNRPVYEALVLPGRTLTEADLTAAKSAADVFFGYKFSSLQNEDSYYLSTPITEATVINAVYVRDAETKYSVAVDGVDLDESYSFDSRLTVKSSTGDKVLWKINDANYDISSETVLYVFGEIDIVAEEKPEDMDENAPFVSILGALVDRDSYVIFAHAYSGGKDISKLGVKFINGRSRDELSDIAWDDEILSGIKFKDAAIIGKKELMATLYGTRAGTVRMAQAYAVFSDNSIVYGANTTKTQNF